MENFHRSMPHVFKHEGGWSDHPADRGGATHRGITLQVYRDWLKNPHATKEQLRALSEDTARTIYKQRYWDPSRASELPHGVDLMVFDMAINAGINRSIRLLQEVLGVPVDGIIGAQTIAATRDADPNWLIDELKVRQERFYKSLDRYPVFGRGWLARLEARHHEAHLILAEASPPPEAA